MVLGTRDNPFPEFPWPSLLLTYFFVKGNWMAWCKRDVSDFFRWNFFSFKSACIFACAFQLSSTTFPCIFFCLVCTLFLRKTKTKYWSVHNEHNKAEQEHFSQKTIQENVFLLNWKAHAKIQALLKEKKFHLKKSVTSLLHQAIQLLTNHSHEDCKPVS